MMGSALRFLLVMGVVTGVVLAIEGFIAWLLRRKR
jgi:hypothetical protein